MIMTNSVFVRCRIGIPIGLLALMMGITGCRRVEKATVEAAGTPPVVQLIKLSMRDIKREVGQPSFVEAYERTSIYPKMTAYIKKWNVDIGDKVKKGDTLATLFVPELVEDWKTKKATVILDKEKIDLALQRVEVARADVKAADARLDETRKILGQYTAQVDRWDVEVQRLAREVTNGVIDPQVLLESRHQLASSISAREAAKATIQKADAEFLAKKATLAQDEVAVRVAQANLGVADSDEKRLEALVGYLTLPAPFDGIIVARNANTLDFVLPATGDPSADSLAPHLSPGNKAAPIYVVDRTDIVRVFMDIPERDANYVKAGSRAMVQVKGFNIQWIPGSVTRTAWALNVKSRTLRAEIDLKNTDTQILPGMYAYGKVIIDRPNVRAIPEKALIHQGDSTFYWQYSNGKSIRTEIETGVSDGAWVEVLNRKGKADALSSESWVPFDGTEQVILGDLSLLVDGGDVRLQSDSGAKADAEPAK